MTFHSKLFTNCIDCLLIIILLISLLRCSILYFIYEYLLSFDTVGAENKKDLIIFISFFI
jgi:hypothetical protein